MVNIVEQPDTPKALPYGRIVSALLGAAALGTWAVLDPKSGPRLQTLAKWSVLGAPLAAWLISEYDDMMAASEPVRDAITLFNEYKNHDLEKSRRGLAALLDLLAAASNPRAGGAVSATRAPDVAHQIVRYGASSFAGFIAFKHKDANASGAALVELLTLLHSLAPNHGLRQKLCRANVSSALLRRLEQLIPQAAELTPRWIDILGFMSSTVAALVATDTFDVVLPTDAPAAAAGATGLAKNGKLLAALLDACVDGPTAAQVDFVTGVVQACAAVATLRDGPSALAKADAPAKVFRVLTPAAIARFGGPSEAAPLASAAASFLKWGMRGAAFRAAVAAVSPNKSGVVVPVSGPAPPSSEWRAAADIFSQFMGLFAPLCKPQPQQRRPMMMGRAAEDPASAVAGGVVKDLIGALDAIANSKERVPFAAALTEGSLRGLVLVHCNAQDDATSQEALRLVDVFGAAHRPTGDLADKVLREMSRDIAKRAELDAAKKAQQEAERLKMRRLLERVMPAEDITDEVLDNPPPEVTQKLMMMMMMQGGMGGGPGGMGGGMPMGGMPGMGFDD